MLDAVQTWREQLFDVLTRHDEQDRITTRLSRRQGDPAGRRSAR